MKLTGWYQGYQKPKHKGLYQRSYGGIDHWYSFWDGQHWLCGKKLKDSANKVIAISSFQNLPWRGVAK